MTCVTVFFVATTVASTTIGSDTFPTVTFKRQTAATALKQKVEYSFDLTTWLLASEYTSTGGTQFGPLLELARTPGPIETITLRAITSGANEPKRFYRVVTER